MSSERAYYCLNQSSKPSPTNNFPVLRNPPLILQILATIEKPTKVAGQGTLGLQNWSSKSLPGFALASQRSRYATRSL